jgi:hypothetical protein
MCRYKNSHLLFAGVSPLHPTKTFLERKVLDSKELKYRI